MSFFDVKPTIETLSEFKLALAKFEVCDYSTVFRGHGSASWKLLPSAYRDSEIRASWERYPIKQTEIKKWIGSDELFNRIRNLLPKELNLPRHKFLSLVLPCNTHWIPLKNIITNYLNIMRYNYDLCTFHNKHKNYYSYEYLSSLYEHPNAEEWCKFDKLLYLLGTIKYMFNLFDASTGKLLNQPWILDAETGFDQSLIQHFGDTTKTSILDWSNDPYIALYFATKDILLSKPIYVSIYTLKVLKPDSNFLKLILPNPHIKNIRAERQKGVFTLLPQSNLYFLLNNQHPTIESFINLNGDYFYIEKNNILLNHDILSFAKKILYEKNYTTEYLEPSISSSV